MPRSRIRPRSSNSKRSCSVAPTAISLRLVSSCQPEVMELEATAGSKVVGQPLKSLGFPYGSIVGAVVRRGEVFIPDGDEEVLPQDQLFLLARHEDLPGLMELGEVEPERHHRVRIMGGGLVGNRIAELLDRNSWLRDHNGPHAHWICRGVETRVSRATALLSAPCR